LQGTIVNSINDKTVVVKVERRYIHKIYKKIVSSSKKYLAHHEKNQLKSGDVVRIIESYPFSKTKKWSVFFE
jgi:small subunit ribosomal protein S17